MRMSTPLTFVTRKQLHLFTSSYLAVVACCKNIIQFWGRKQQDHRRHEFSPFYMQRENCRTYLLIMRYFVCVSLFVENKIRRVYARVYLFNGWKYCVYYTSLPCVDKHPAFMIIRKNEENLTHFHFIFAVVVIL